MLPLPNLPLSPRAPTVRPFLENRGLGAHCPGLYLGSSVYWSYDRSLSTAGQDVTAHDT